MQDQGRGALIVAEAVARAHVVAADRGVVVVSKGGVAIRPEAGGGTGEGTGATGALDNDRPGGRGVVDDDHLRVPLLLQRLHELHVAIAGRLGELVGDAKGRI